MVKIFFKNLVENLLILDHFRSFLLEDGFLQFEFQIYSKLGVGEPIVDLDILKYLVNSAVTSGGGHLEQLKTPSPNRLSPKKLKSTEE